MGQRIKIRIPIRVHVTVCVCVCVGERERAKHRTTKDVHLYQSSSTTEVVGQAFGFVFGFPSETEYRIVEALSRRWITHS